MTILMPRRSQCDGKIRYMDSPDAMEGIFQKHGHRHLSSFNCYKCPHCSSWHIGHVSRKVMEKIKLIMAKPKSKTTRKS